MRNLLTILLLILLLAATANAQSVRRDYSMQLLAKYNQFRQTYGLAPIQDNPSLRFATDQAANILYDEWHHLDDITRNDYISVKSIIDEGVTMRNAIGFFVFFFNDYPQMLNYIDMEFRNHRTNFVHPDVRNFQSTIKQDNLGQLYVVIVLSR
jgi:hypothetical protein